MHESIQVQTTTDQQDSALAIAQDLIGHQLAACVQVSGPITSIYRWAGNVETATEWLCTIKTTAERYAAVEQRIRQLHTYEEPEIVATDIVAGSAGYLQWVKRQVSGDETDG